MATPPRRDGLEHHYKYLLAASSAQFLFTGIRLGLYERAKQSSEGDLALGERIVLAVATSAAGIVAANPSDVLKVRFQAHSLKGSALSMYAKVASTEGLFKGLYKGFGANLAR